MIWIVRTATSSIGKKLIMAVTGLGFCGFLAMHLIGNLTLYGGRDFFLSYVEHLHSWGVLVTVAEWGLVFFALVHIGTGLLLFYQNLKARPVSYAVKKWAGGRTIGSATAPYTGILILIFVIIHLLTFRFVDKTNVNDFMILSDTFTGIGYVLFYVVAVVIVAVHVSHGFWSGFQTLGLNHPKYMPIIRNLGLLFSIGIGVGFGSIPLFMLTIL
ncbi:MAG: succinate dehydrogenase cytochrome b subunit [Deltaproteobacteria bacterium]|nr:succinate dehydrogenase cytochrome b subunit [Deltaproteobacteria bacterium]